VYARFSVARLPQFCPQCGRRVIRHRDPNEDSPGMAHWHAVAEQLTRDQPGPEHKQQQ
jgi:hypothetical protein